ncbi:substrate-binding periplasmic protein [Herbaspirillum sp. GCM10030257]|uniref:substrate-binding periplasmic protein n=1 Tax=Herbaspirillum sp. GCM10030257 TaxID=3273393 RepID=UPI0036200D2A
MMSSVKLLKWLFCTMCLITGHTVARAVELRTAAEDSAPKYLMRNGEMSGLCIDILKAIEAAAPDIKFTGYDRFYPKLRIEASLAKGELDLFCGIGRTQKRNLLFSFLNTPLYWTEMRLAARIDDPVDNVTLDGLKAANKNMIVLVVHGTEHVDYLLHNGVTNIDAGAHNTYNNLNKLIAGRGRLAYLTDLSLVHELSNKNFHSRLRILPGVINIQPEYLAISNTIAKSIRDRLQEVLAHLHSRGDLKRLHMRYMQIDGPVLLH